MNFFSSPVLTSTLNNILASIIAFYSFLYSNLFDAYDYIQDQTELYFIVAKFIYEQTSPRINSQTALLIFIQAASIATLIYVCASQIKLKHSRIKKIRFINKSEMEEIELVRVRLEKEPSTSNNMMALNSISESKDPLSNMDTSPFILNAFAIKNKETSVVTESKEPQAPLKVRLCYCETTSSTKLKEHTFVNIRKGPSNAGRVKLSDRNFQIIKECECYHPQIDDLDRPKPDISDILDALTEFDRNVAHSRQLIDDHGKKRGVNHLNYLFNPFPADIFAVSK